MKPILLFNQFNHWINKVIVLIISPKIDKNIHQAWSFKQYRIHYCLYYIKASEEFSLIKHEVWHSSKERRRGSEINPKAVSIKGMFFCWQICHTEINGHFLTYPSLSSSFFLRSKSRWTTAQTCLASSSVSLERSSFLPVVLPGMLVSWQAAWCWATVWMWGKTSN